MVDRIITDDALAFVLDAACSAARKFEFTAAGPVVSEQDGGASGSRELILADGQMFRVQVEFEAS